MNIIIIIIAALLPAVALVGFIYRKDSDCPEPKRWLWKGFLYGVGAAILSFAFSYPLQWMGTYSAEPTTIIGHVREAFFGAAIPEELAKLLMLILLLRRCSYFDERMDGIVYAVCISMGFAGFENVLYLFSNYDSWLPVCISRALISVPAHFIFAIWMGYYFSLYRFAKDDHHACYGLLMLLIPIMVHGTFDAVLLNLSLFPTGLGILLTLALFAGGRRLWKYNSQLMENCLQVDREAFAPSDESDENSRPEE